MTYKVGDRLWWVSSQKPTAQGSVVIRKVGRKWLTLSNSHRVDIGSLLADGRGYSSPGRCYRSSGEYHRVIAETVVWRELRLAIEGKHNPPPGVTAKDIFAAATLCGIAIKSSERLLHASGERG